MSQSDVENASSSTPTPWFILAASAAFPFLVVCQLVLGLRNANAGLLSSSDSSLVWLWTALLIAWGATFAVLRFGRSASKFVWAVLAGYAFFLLVRDVAFPVPLGELDGADPLAAVTKRYQAVETAALLGLIAAVFLVPQRMSQRLAAVLSVAFIAALPFAGGRAKTPPGSAAGLPSDMVTLVSNQDGPRPDIFHIMFDTYQTVEHQFTVQNSGSVSPYDDFIVFPNNLANYNFTELVIPTTFSGTLYESQQDISDWKSRYATQGLLADLKKAGYKIHGHSYAPFYFSSPLCDHERHTVDVIASAEQNAGDGQIVRSSFFELVVLRCLPTLGSRFVMKRIKQDSGAVAGLPPRSASAYYCTLKFREVLSQLKSTPPGNNYYFLHLILPHSPFVLDKDGNYLGGDFSTHYQQSLFADQLAGELIDLLKSLNRYDESLIVIQADTGEYFVPDVSKQQLQNGNLLSYVVPQWKNGEMVFADEISGERSSIWPVDSRHDARRCPEEIVRARSQSLLLIKPPFHRGYEVNPGPSQSADIAPTILGAAAVPYNAQEYPEGVDLLKAALPKDRVRQTFVLGALRSGSRTGGLQSWTVKEGQFIKGESLPVRDDQDIYRIR